MKRFNNYLLVVVFLFCASVANAQTVRSTFGNPVSGIYNIKEKTDGIVYMRPTGGVKWAYESVTTSDTLTAIESGKTFVWSGTVTTEFELPAAVVGMNFRFVTATDTASIVLDPNGTELIRFSTLVEGDAIKSPGASADSIELFCATAGEWSVPNINGTWTDDN